jgi:hypothetical protein
MQVLQRLRNAVRGKGRSKFQGQWFLHHDNTPSHTSPGVEHFLAEKNIPVITQQLYSPDLAPSGFCLFPTLKMGRKRTGSETMEDNQIECDGQTPEDFKRSLLQ